LRLGFPRPQPGPPATRAQPNGEPVDLVLSRAMEQVASGNVNVARGTLLRWLTEHAGDPRIERPLLELERGVLILFQHQTPDMTSPYSPIWASDGIALTGRHNFRFGIASASECHVYVYQTDTRPSVTLVFPNPRYSPLANPIPPGTVLWLPGDPKKPRPTWLHLDTATGEQAIYFVAVKSPLRDPAGLGRQLIDHPMTDSLDSMLRGYTADGRPADSCFAAAAPVQVFRFRHEREKPAPPGKITVGSRGPSSSFAPMG
jgi:hypothetical protein